MRMRKVSAEENDAAQPFFFDDLDRGVMPFTRMAIALAFDRFRFLALLFGT